MTLASLRTGSLTLWMLIQVSLFLLSLLGPAGLWSHMSVGVWSYQEHPVYQETEGVLLLILIHLLYPPMPSDCPSLRGALLALPLAVVVGGRLVIL